MRYDLPTLFDTLIRSKSQSILSDETEHGSRILSQPELSCENCNMTSSVYGERKWEWKGERKKETASKTMNNQYVILKKKYNNGAKIFMLKFNISTNNQLTSLHSDAKINNNENGASV